MSSDKIKTILKRDRYLARVVRQLLKNRTALFGIFLFLSIVMLAVLVPVFSVYDYSGQDVSSRNVSPSFTHLFGTDKFGRDLFVRTWYGARISLTVGLLSTAVNLVIGILYGGIAGYRGGMLDSCLMRLADMIASIPSLLYIILIMLVLGSGVGSIVLGICVSGFIPLARVVRSEVMRLKEEEFCLAARVSGAGGWRILFHHLLINAVGPIIVAVMLMIPEAIFMESFLSFVGIGIAAPMASLGTLIQEARSQIFLYPMQIVYPILILCLLIIGLNLMGDGLLKATDPRKERCVKSYDAIRSTQSSD